MVPTTSSPLAKRQYYVLGFTTEYYTLWEVSEPYRKYTSGMVLNGRFTGSFYMVQDYHYIQNLSKDHATALAKITEKSGGDFKVNLELRGHSSFSDRLSGTDSNDMPDTVFSFGQLMGKEIMQAVDVWQLDRAARSERGKRRRVYARRRLIELGCLVRNTTARDGERWVSPKQLAYLQDRINKSQASGHHYENGKRITVSLKWVGGTSYESQYGTVYIREYMTEDGKLLKYKGSSPIQIDEEFIKVTGTVEHSEYQGQPETRLKRMKKTA